ncbi:hypothetical protein CRG98_039788 [Punica granatum]|uniref:Uncharacterized protein n=1 Tax=Punica granatum TaxID=22663 RepID=A0A2I0I7H2_PUNGR|nr:hypothetical protein CRG98_039788 [Punica granatum]
MGPKIIPDPHLIKDPPTVFEQASDFLSFIAIVTFNQGLRYKLPDLWRERDVARPAIPAPTTTISSFRTSPPALTVQKRMSRFRFPTLRRRVQLSGTARLQWWREKDEAAAMEAQRSSSEVQALWESGDEMMAYGWPSLLLWAAAAALAWDWPWKLVVEKRR